MTADRPKDHGMSVRDPREALTRLLAEKEDLDWCIQTVEAEIEREEARD